MSDDRDLLSRSMTPSEWSEPETALARIPELLEQILESLARIQAGQQRVIELLASVARSQWS